MAAGYKVVSTSQTVTTAGSRVRLTSSTVLTDSIEIFAKSTNTGTISVGDDTVANTHAPLSAGQAVSLRGPNVRGSEGLFDLNKIYIDSTANGDGVDLTYIARIDEGD